MLAYELHLKNKKINIKNVKDAKPVKLAYLMSSKINLDEKSLSQYTGQPHPKFSYLQEWLQMSMNTAPEMPDNLYSGGRAAKPYVIISGYYTKEENKPALILSIKDKLNIFEAKLLLDKEKSSITLDCKDSIQLNLTKTRYSIDGKNTYDLYHKNKIIDENDCFDATIFSSIAETFFSYVKSRKPLKDIEIPKRPLSFDFK